MLIIESSVDIARPPQQVFDYLSDLRNERDWNPTLRSVQLLTGEPIGVGSRFRARWAGSSDNTVEYTRYDRPHDWASAAVSRLMDINFSARVTPSRAGSHLEVRMELIPHGAAKLLQPILRRRMRAQETANMARIKSTMERSVPDV
jgi:uncharacterized protein YndB with AHSA1/START domain